uniref:30S ribosomal protein S2 n=1 Tax=Nephromyces sp. ex Molgula occidentalis TaxID=2544991 RepID=A0A5C1H878_9APIC|nr:30S ribosomal protein S2 [Nephromyces sp. ex Molgula occidentalis]
MNLISLQDLINSKVQIGHLSKQSLNSYKQKFVYKIINNICIIDLIQTYKYLLKSYIFFYKIGVYNKKILFINTQNNYNTLIEKSAILTDQFYLTKYFIPGILTNWKIIQKNILLLNWFYKIIILNKKNNFLNNINNKIKNKLLKIYYKLKNKFDILNNMKKVPEIIFILDINKDIKALKEAKKLNKIIISIVDSNWNYNLIDLFIPGNNKNYFSIKLILEILITSLLQGQFKYKNLLDL